MKRSLLAMLLIGHLGQAATAEPPDWAKDASAAAKDRKIMRGTPHDSSLQGERPVKRDELAEILERLDVESQRESEDFVTKDDLKSTENGVGSLKAELESMNTRIESLEERSDEIEQRDREVARPRL